MAASAFARACACAPAWQAHHGGRTRRHNFGPTRGAYQTTGGQQTAHQKHPPYIRLQVPCCVALR
eukprot:9503828-Pyramimonas_sp.AAC.2